MADSRFFKRNRPITVKKLADMVGGKLGSGLTGNEKIKDVNSPELADCDEIIFARDKRHLKDMGKSKAGFIFAAEEVPESDKKFIIVSNPNKAFLLALDYFYKNKNPAGISKKAVISKDAKIGKNCYIGDFVVIKEGVEIGDNCFINAGTYIDHGVKIGNNCVIESNVSIYYAIIGNDVVIDAGTRIGTDGFAFINTPHGHEKILQVGRAILEDKVDVGANVTIDRGALGDTVIGEGTKIDNLVQIGHNVKIGKHCVIVSQVGIAGSSKLGQFVFAGGQVGIAGHLNIGNMVRIAAQSGIARDIEDGQTVMGSPAVPMKEFFRQTVILNKMAKREK